MSYELEEKETPVGADQMVIKDSEDNGKVKAVLLQDLKMEQQLIIMGYAANIAGNQSGYLTVNDGETKLSGTESYNQIQMLACSVKSIKGQALGAGDMTLTLRKNGEDTGITAQITSAGDFEITGSGPVSFARGDKLSVAFSCPPAGGILVGGIAVAFETEVF